MKRILPAFAVFTLVACTARLNAAEPQLAHMVFFTLAEDNHENQQALISACQKYLSGHEGTVHFSTGAIAEDLSREVNDREFDVSLHLVFANKKAHDTYQTHPRHLKFIEAHQHLWTKVRVFDSYLAPPAHDAIPDDAQGFAGMLRGKVVGTGSGRLLVQVKEITNVWKHSDAENPEALVGQTVAVKPRGGEGRISRFVSLVKAGESIELDVAHKQNGALTLLELTEKQRERVK